MAGIAYRVKMGKPQEIQIMDQGVPIDLSQYTVTNENPKFATFANGFVTPVAPGSTWLTFESATAKLKVRVLVLDPKEEEAVVTHDFKGSAIEHEADNLPVREIEIPTAPTNVTITPGAATIVPMTIKNSGNRKDTMVLHADIPEGYVATFYHDKNANDVVDEVIDDVLLGKTVDLDPGVSAKIIAVIDTPANVTEAQPIKVRVHSKANVNAKHEVVLVSAINITTTLAPTTTAAPTTTTAAPAAAWSLVANAENRTLTTDGLWTEAGNYGDPGASWNGPTARHDLETALGDFDIMVPINWDSSKENCLSMLNFRIHAADGSVISKLAMSDMQSSYDDGQFNFYSGEATHVGGAMHLGAHVDDFKVRRTGDKLELFQGSTLIATKASGASILEAAYITVELFRFATYQGPTAMKIGAPVVAVPAPTTTAAPTTTTTAAPLTAPSVALAPGYDPVWDGTYWTYKVRVSGSFMMGDQVQIYVNQVGVDAPYVTADQVAAGYVDFMRIANPSATVKFAADIIRSGNAQSARSNELTVNTAAAPTTTTAAPTTTTAAPAAATAAIAGAVIRYENYAQVGMDYESTMMKDNVIITSASNVTPGAYDIAFELDNTIMEMRRYKLHINAQEVWSSDQNMYTGESIQVNVPGVGDLTLTLDVNDFQMSVYNQSVYSWQCKLLVSDDAAPALFGVQVNGSEYDFFWMNAPITDLYAEGDLAQDFALVYGNSPTDALMTSALTPAGAFHGVYLPGSGTYELKGHRSVQEMQMTHFFTDALASVVV